MAGDIHDKIARDAGITQSVVRCEACGTTLTVDGATCLRRGWPLCHGETMRLLPLEAPDGR